MRAIGLGLIGVALAVGCATTPEMMEDRWEKLEKASYDAGFVLGGILYAQTGKLSSVDEEIVRTGERVEMVVGTLPGWEAKSYLLVEARARVEGLNAFRDEMQKKGVKADE
jgi:hypothetical protein